MDLKPLRDAVADGRIEWLKHSAERMFERGIARAEAVKALLEGEVIEDDPDDTPYPSALLLGVIDGKPLHVVVAYDTASAYCMVITVYQPDTEHFEPDHRTRRRHGR
jgi:hypothetical protein